MSPFVLLYIRLILCAVVGAIISLLLKNKAQFEKADGARIDYSFTEFLRHDKWNIIITYACVLIFFLIAGDIFDPKHLKNPDGVFDILGIFEFPIRVVYIVVTSAISATVGFSAQEVMLKVFGVTNKLINRLIKEQSAETPMTPLPK